MNQLVRLFVFLFAIILMSDYFITLADAKVSRKYYITDKILIKALSNCIYILYINFLVRL